MTNPAQQHSDLKSRQSRFLLDDQRLNVPDYPITLDELRARSSPPIPDDHVIWRDSDGGKDVALADGQTFEIAAGDVLYSEGPNGAHPRSMKIVINDEVIAAPAVSLTGAQIRALTTPPIPPRDRLFCDVDGSRDEAITDGEVVTLQFGAEFYTRTPFFIVVNGREKYRDDIEDRDLTFEEVIGLAFDNPPNGPQVTFSVTYRNGPTQQPTGTLVAGRSVKARKGMIFNVTATDKS